MANVVASLNRIELQIRSKSEASGDQASPHQHGQGQVEVLLDLDRSLNMERASAFKFELTRAPSPPLVKFRIDSDSFSINSRLERSDVIKNRASFFLLNSLGPER
jgi:hypothetical protein